MSICAHCGAEFACGAADSQAAQPCWCTQFPALPREAYVSINSETKTARCYCPACLRALLARTKPPFG